MDKLKRFLGQVGAVMVISVTIAIFAIGLYSVLTYGVDKTLSRHEAEEVQNNTVKGEYTIFQYTYGWTNSVEVKEYTVEHEDGDTVVRYIDTEGHKNTLIGGQFAFINGYVAREALSNYGYYRVEEVLAQ